MKYLANIIKYSCIPGLIGSALPIVLSLIPQHRVTSTTSSIENALGLIIIFFILFIYTCPIFISALLTRYNKFLDAIFYAVLAVFITDFINAFSLGVTNQLSVGIGPTISNSFFTLPMTLKANYIILNRTLFSLVITIVVVSITRFFFTLHPSKNIPKIK